MCNSCLNCLPLAGSGPDDNCQTNKLAFWCFSELVSDEGIRALHRALLESLFYCTLLFIHILNLYKSVRCKSAWNPTVSVIFLPEQSN